MTTRLSKLQKWILEKCLNDLRIRYQDIFAFFGKRGTKGKPSILHEEYDLEKRFGKNYKKEFDIERVKRGSGTYVWKGLKVSRKPEFCITNSEKAIISRSLKGLMKKGYLVKSEKWKDYRLTNEGFIKANNNVTACGVVSFKEYQHTIDGADKERDKRFGESCVNME